MPVTITYDKEGKKVPAREFLSMVAILLRKCEMETDMSLIQFLESLEDSDPDLDSYDDKLLLKAIYKMITENYPDEVKT